MSSTRGCSRSSRSGVLPAERCEVVGPELPAKRHPATQAVGEALGPARRASLHRAIGEALGERCDEAMAHFETALAVHRDMGATPYVAFTERDREAVLRARDGRGPGTRRGAVGAGGTYD